MLHIASDAPHIEIYAFRQTNIQIHTRTDKHAHSKTLLPYQGRVLITHTHTHTRLTALFPGLPGWAGTRKVKPIWILLKQETVSGSGISWAICKSAPCSRQITTPAPHHSDFLQAGCPSCRPTNSIKALKAKSVNQSIIIIIIVKRTQPRITTMDKHLHRSAGCYREIEYHLFSCFLDT